MYISLYIFMYLFLYLLFSICESIYIISVSIHLSKYLTIKLTIKLCTHLSYLSICLSISLSFYHLLFRFFVLLFFLSQSVSISILCLSNSADLYRPLAHQKKSWELWFFTNLICKCHSRHRSLPFCATLSPESSAAADFPRPFDPLGGQNSE